MGNTNIRMLIAAILAITLTILSPNLNATDNDRSAIVETIFGDYFRDQAAATTDPDDFIMYVRIAESFYDAQTSHLTTSSIQTNLNVNNANSNLFIEPNTLISTQQQRNILINLNQAPIQLIGSEPPEIASFINAQNASTLADDDLIMAYNSGDNLWIAEKMNMKVDRIEEVRVALANIPEVLIPSAQFEMDQNTINSFTIDVNLNGLPQGEEDALLADGATAAEILILTPLIGSQITLQNTTISADQLLQFHANSLRESALQLAGVNVPIIPPVFYIALVLSIIYIVYFVDQKNRKANVQSI